MYLSGFTMSKIWPFKHYFSVYTDRKGQHMENVSYSKPLSKYSTIYVSFYTPMLSDHIFLDDFLLLINVHIIRVNSNQNASTWYWLTVSFIL